LREPANAILTYYASALWKAFANRKYGPATRFRQWQRGALQKRLINESGIEQTVVAFDVILKMFRRVLAPPLSGAFLSGTTRRDPD
jgi:hypothetical protein